MRQVRNTWWERARRSGIPAAVAVFLSLLLILSNRGPLISVVMSLGLASLLLVLIRWEARNPRGSRRLVIAWQVIVALFFDLFGLSIILLGVLERSTTSWILVPGGLVFLALGLPGTIYAWDSLRAWRRK